MTVAGQDAASFSDEGEVVARAAEIFRTCRFFSAFAGCEGSFDGRDTRRRIDVVDGNGESRFMVAVVQYWAAQMKSPSFSRSGSSVTMTI